MLLAARIWYTMPSVPTTTYFWMPSVLVRVCCGYPGHRVTLLVLQRPEGSSRVGAVLAGPSDAVVERLVRADEIADLVRT